MKCITYIFLLFFIQISSITYGRRYERAYVILSTGDSLYGYIEKERDVLMSFNINFSESQSFDSIKILKPTDIIGFTFLDKNEIYKSINYQQKTIDGTFEHNRIAKCIFDNEIHLYKLYLPEKELNYKYEKIKNYAYIMQIDTNVYTLTQYEKIIKKEEFKTSYYEGVAYHRTPTYSILVKDYIGILLYVFKDCPDISRKIPNLDLYDKDVISLISYYINCK